MSSSLVKIFWPSVATISVDYKINSQSMDSGNRPAYWIETKLRYQAKSTTFGEGFPCDKLLVRTREA